MPDELSLAVAAFEHLISAVGSNGFGLSTMFRGSAD
jgi:hypothetical protein